MKNRNLRKRWMAFVAAAVMVVSMLPGMAQTAKAAGETGTFTLNGVVQSGTLIDSGYADSNHKFTYKIIERSDGTRHLEFTGSGDMPNYGDHSELDDRWKEVEKITTVAFCKGITRIGSYTVNLLYGLEEIWLPEGLLEIGVGALWDYNGSYLRIPSTVTIIGNNAFSRYSGANLTYPVSLTDIGVNNGFWDVNNLYYPGTAETFKENVRGPYADVLYDKIEANNGFNSKDRNYDNYIEYVPFAAGATPASDKFVDVPSGAYYEDAVDWAVDTGITTGTDTTHFSPNVVCTRGQAVTFLYRYYGSPAVSGTSPFGDVARSSSYYNAVLWAAEKGITQGLSATVFGVNTPCSRAQIVTLMWRAAGKPSITASVQMFDDVPSTGYFYGSVSWANEKGITRGTDSTHFSPNEPCTRAQIVTFIYRNN